MSTGIEGFYLHFSMEIFESLSLHRSLESFHFLKFLSNPVITVNQQAKKNIVQLCNRLLDLYGDIKPEDHEIAAFNVLTIFAEVNQFSAAESNRAKNAAVNLVQQYKDHLSQKIYQHQKVSEYAEILSVTPNHLNKCVKSVTNKTAQELLNEMMTLEAKSLLKYSNLQIAEIAVKLCNQNPSNFARFFKKQTGISPKTYQS